MGLDKSRGQPLARDSLGQAHLNGHAWHQFSSHQLRSWQAKALVVCPSEAGEAKQDREASVVGLPASHMLAHLLTIAQDTGLEHAPTGKHEIPQSCS
jgi:hypothetical protein